jgi:hypothetical protein
MLLLPQCCCCHAAAAALLLLRTSESLHCLASCLSVSVVDEAKALGLALVVLQQMNSSSSSSSNSSKNMARSRSVGNVQHICFRWWQAMDLEQLVVVLLGNSVARMQKTAWARCTQGEHAMPS